MPSSYRACSLQCVHGESQSEEYINWFTNGCKLHGCWRRTITYVNTALEFHS